MRSNAPAFIDQDGYVIVQAKSRARRVPFLGVFLLALGFFALKGLMIAGIGLLALGLLAMWGIEILDSAILDDRLQRNGIQPRQIDFHPVSFEIRYRHISRRSASL